MDDCASVAYRVTGTADEGIPLDKVQSHVLRSMDPQQALFLFFRITALKEFRTFIKVMLKPPARESDSVDFTGLDPTLRRIWSEKDQVAASRSENTAAPEESSRPRDTLPRSLRERQLTSWNLAFTWPGLAALEVDPNTLASFPIAFRDGMAMRAEPLGDDGESSPDNWEGWLGSRQVHGILWANDRRPATKELPVTDIVAMVEKAAADYGFEVLQKETGLKIVATDPNGETYRIEHFGFRDGVSQPFLDLNLGSPPPGGGTAHADGTWTPVAAGELLLGYPDEDGNVQRRPANEALRANGTYLVFRKLEQDVLGFRRFVAGHEARFTRESRLAAHMLGRHANGTPLELSPDGPIYWPPASVEQHINNFRYLGDPRGERCPVSAHIRRANPRDTNNRDEARRHRLFRRAISYGGPFIPYDSPGDGAKRGLLFMAFNARIDEQFEFVQSRWLNGGEFMGQAGLGRCPIVGANAGRTEDGFVGPNRPAPYPNVPRFVTTRGGDYFFMPSIPALQGIADGETFPSQPEDENPGLDQTPKAIDLGELFAVGRDKLLPPGSPPFIDYKGLVLVGRHQYVLDVLKDDTNFSVSDYDQRIRQVTGNEHLIVGLTEGTEERKLRLDIWRAAQSSYRGPPPDKIAAAAMQAILTRYGPTGKLELVGGVGFAVVLALARSYYGIVGPDWLSPSAVAAKFNKLDIAQVPQDWLAVLPPPAPADLPYATLQAWLFYPFIEIFENVVNDHDLAQLAERITAELFRYLDMLIGEAFNYRSALKPTTLLAALAMLDPATFGVSAERFRILIRLLLAELMAASLRTLSQAIASIINALLADRKRLAEARDPALLDGAIREALRFDPVAQVLFRIPAAGAKIGDIPVPADNRLVCVLLKTAMFDPNVFADPAVFDPSRPDTGYLVFGSGPHACRGAAMATDVLRAMVKPLVALDGLRHAAGPAAEQWDPFGHRQSMVVRFNPPGN